MASVDPAVFLRFGRWASDSKTSGMLAPLESSGGGIFALTSSLDSGNASVVLVSLLGALLQRVTRECLDGPHLARWSTANVRTTGRVR